MFRRVGLLFRLKGRMMIMRNQQTLPKLFSGAGMIFGLALIILGLLSMAAPILSGVAIMILVGIFMIAGGVARLLWAFRADSLGRGFLSVLLGGFFILAGVVLLARPLLGLVSLTMVLAAFFLIDGLFEIMTAFKLKGRDGWYWLLVGGIASMVLGLLIWKQWPLSGAWAVGVLVGIKMLFAGTAMISIASAARTADPGAE